MSKLSQIGKARTPKLSISCSEVPNELLIKPTATHHFEKFGNSSRITFRPRRNFCRVEYSDEDSAERAYHESSVYEGQTFKVAWTRPRNPEKKADRKKTNSNTDWAVDSQVQEELEAMKGSFSDRIYRLRHEATKNLDVVSRESKSSSLTKKSSKPRQWMGDKFNKTKQSTPVTVSTEQAAELLRIIMQPASTCEEKYRILDARDKLIRLKSVRQSDLANVSRTVGTCPDMCPEKERVMREAQHQVAVYEQASSDKYGGMNHAIAVKQYSRSSADQESPLAHELRPVQVLQLTMGYLLHRIMDLCDVSDVNIAEWYHFLWDRTRGIRKDITQQELCCLGSVSLVEQCARFHIHCSARLVAEDVSVFDQKINTENLTKCLQTLKYMYHDLALKNEKCPNEPEFRAYIVLLNLQDGNFMWEVQQLSREIQQSPEMKFALQVYSAIDEIFQTIRITALGRILKSYSPRQPYTQFPLEELKNILAFEDIENTIAFLEYYGLRMNFERTHVVVDRKMFCQPNIPFSLERAINVIEAKRVCSVGETVCGSSLPSKDFQNHIPHNSFDDNGHLKLSEIPKEWQSKYQSYLSEMSQNQSPDIIDDEDYFEMEESEPASFVFSTPTIDFNLDVKPIVTETPTTFVFQIPTSPFKPQTTFSEKNSFIFGNTTENKEIQESDVQRFVDTNIVESKTEVVPSPVISFVPKDEPVKSFSFTSPNTMPVSELHSTTGQFNFDASKNMFENIITPSVFKDFPKDISPEIKPTATEAQTKNIFSNIVFPPLIPSEANNLLSFPKLPTREVSPKDTTDFKTPEIYFGLKPVSKVTDLRTAPPKPNDIKNIEEDESRTLELLKIEYSKMKEERRKEKRRKKALEEARKKQEEEKIQKSINKVTKKLLNDLLDVVEKYEIESKLEEIKEKIKKRRSLYYISKWKDRTAVSRKKRHNFFDNSTWVSAKTVENEAKELSTSHQSETLQDMKRYKYGSSIDIEIKEPAKMKKLDLFNTVWKILFEKLSGANEQICLDIYWKIAVSIPDEYEMISGLELLEKKLQQTFDWDLVDGNYMLLKRCQANNGGTLSCCVKRISSTEISDSISYLNGMIFIAENKISLLFYQRFIHTFTNEENCSGVPVVNILRNSKCSTSRIVDQLNLDDLVSQGNISDYQIFNTAHLSDSDFASILFKALQWLAVHVNNPPSLQMDALPVCIQNCIGTEFLYRLSSSASTNKCLQKLFCDPNTVISIYNEALYNLLSVVFSKDILNEAEFPQEFKQFLNFDVISLPCTYEYFPDYWKQNSYIDKVTSIIQLMKFPKFEGKWPNTEEFLLKFQLEQYCKKLFSNPEIVVMKILSVILRKFPVYKSEECLERIGYFMWMDIFGILIREKINNLNFHDEKTQNLLTVVYKIDDMKELRTNSWWYNSLILKSKMDTVSEIEEHLFEEPSIVSLSDEDFDDDCDIDSSILEMQVDDAYEEKDDTLKKELKELSFLANDLETSLEIHKKIISKFKQTAELALGLN